MNDPSRTCLLLALSDPLPIDRLQQISQSLSEWSTLVELASRHDVIPLLHRALETLGEAVPIEVRAQVRNFYAAEALRALQHDSERRRVTALLLAAGIPVIPFKGPVLAQEFYGDVTLRPCVDLDLLVPLELAWRALELLREDGYDPGFDVPAWRWPSLRRAVNHLTLVNGKRNMMVELHWAVFHPMQVWSFDLAAQWQALTDAGEAREGRFGRGELLVLLCVHGANHLWEKLKWVADIDRLVRDLPEPDWSVVLALAGRMGCRRALLLGLLLAREACGTPLPESITAQLSRQPVVERLAGVVRAAWFAEPSDDDLLREALFHLRCRERLRDRLSWILLQLFAPRQADWQLFPLGSRFYPLFYAERPLRMLWKWGVRPLLLWRDRTSVTTP